MSRAQHALFEGPGSIRYPSERVAFWLTVLFAFPIAGLVGFVLHESVGVSQVALLIVVAMIYVTLARGRLLGSSVLLHETQYPRLFEIVRRACAALEIPAPLVFVRDDPNVPAAALGFGEPYALVVSSHWIETFADDELTFMIGRELGHIAAGHTRYLSLLSVNGNENPFVSAIFGAWLRRCTLTCDRAGLLCCGSLNAAIRAIGVASFHDFGRQVDYGAFAEQRTEIENDPIMRWGAWLGSEPYATMRIASLREFVGSRAYDIDRSWFERERDAVPPALPAPGTTTVRRIDCASWGRRFWAFAIDVVVVLALLGSLHAVTSTPSAQELASITLPNGAKGTSYLVLFPFARGITLLTGYLMLLVAVVGQTFGMMIAGLRVVTTDFRRPGTLRTIVRYAIAAVLWPLIAVLSPFAGRIYLHDRITGTRVIGTERTMIRAVR